LFFFFHAPSTTGLYTLSLPDALPISGQGHPDYPCLSRTHAPSSCVPCADFSPWLSERVLRGDSDAVSEYLFRVRNRLAGPARSADRKSTRLNSSHVAISYAVFCLKKK